MDPHRYRAMFDAMLDHVAIGESIRDASGRIVDFRMVHLNAASIDGAGRSGEELVGRSVLETFPGWAGHGLLERFSEVIETGEPYVADRLAYRDVGPDGTEYEGHWSISVVKFGDGYIAASRDVSSLVADERAREEERVAAELESQRSRLAIELLQRAALPTSLPEVAGVELAARYEPALAAQPVGGDWYDAFELEDGRLALAIADVSGHGPDAAAYMVQVRNVVRALAIEHGEPGRVLAQANRVVGRIAEHNLFATCCYLVLEPSTGALAWARAGHFSPLLAGASAAYLPTDVGPPLGVEPDARFPVAVGDLAAGELLVLFTDGLVEDRSEPLKAGLDRLAEVAAGCTGRPTDAVAELLVASAPDRSDDLALICVRRP
jgi:serine phosphatase RsbU (regulator of sigma subunit)